MDDKEEHIKGKKKRKGGKRKKKTLSNVNGLLKTDRDGKPNLYDHTYECTHDCAHGIISNYECETKNDIIQPLVVMHQTQECDDNNDDAKWTIVRRRRNIYSWC